MSKWEEYQLNDVIEKFIDYRGKTPNKVTSGIPLITAKVIKGGTILPPDEFIDPDEYSSWMTRGLPKINDVLLTTEAPLGEVALVQNENIALAQRIILLRGKPDVIDNRFLFYSLQTGLMQHRLSARASGSTVEGIKSAELKKVLIPLPDVNTQKEIVLTLSCLDRKIENLRKQNETLEAIAQTLFKHWFVNFEFPNEDGKPYRSSGGAMVRSELGEIPADWYFLQLGDVATNYSETHKFKNKSEIVFINTGDVLEGNFLHHDYSPIRPLPGQAKKKIRHNDILYSEIRPINKRFAYVNFSDNLDDYVVSTKFMIVRSNQKILPRLLYLILKRDSTIQEFHHIAESRSGTFPQITFESVSKFPIVIPEITLQEKLMSVITPLLEKREFNIQKIKTLTKTRDVLLPKLMSGKLCITE
jgi:type I restriction enzyme, S subunit